MLGYDEVNDPVELRRTVTDLRTKILNQCTLSPSPLNQKVAPINSQHELLLQKRIVELEQQLERLTTNSKPLTVEADSNHNHLFLQVEQLKNENKLLVAEQRNEVLGLRQQFFTDGITCKG